jgi:hypothetical protein
MDTRFDRVDERLTRLGHKAGEPRPAISGPRATFAGVRTTVTDPDSTVVTGRNTFSGLLAIV